jgi:predicted  nucleic acid-binding Zn-ribbon protein
MKGKSMTLDLNVIDDLVFAMTYSEKETEIKKVENQISQLESSIDWLKSLANKQKDHQKKTTILQEVIAAERELLTLRKQISKVETDE